MFNFLKLLWDFFLYKMADNSGNIRKMFTPPKSKTPWQAMTSGSSGGWAKAFAPGQSLGWVGPVGTMAMGAIPVVGPALSALGGAAGTMGDWAPGSGYQGSDYGNRNWGSTLYGAAAGYGAGQFGKSMGSGLQAMFSPSGQYMTTGGASGPVAMNAAQRFGEGFTSTGLGQGVANTVGTVGNKYSYGSGLSGTISNTNMPITSAFNPYGSSKLASTTTSVGKGSSNVNNGINWGQVAGGLATSLAPSLMSEKTQIPESALYGDITSKLLGGKGLSELGALGREKLTGNLNDQFSPVPDEYYNASTRRLDEAYDKAESDFTKQWQATRPGSDIQGDSAYREGINKIRQNRAREKAGLAAELDYRREADYYDRQYQNISQALGVDNQTMQDYMSLAQLDSERLALNTGITLGEAAQFKEIFGNLGGYLMQRGMGLNNPTIALQNLIQRLGGNNGTFR